ncbi:hypothetical protein [Alicyclobacillus fodiniaquatilis]|uniref:ScoMcrA-like N-terminal head domain-containing protein n=1 Tax=Alicyclobacillus fodiniaquatilis TaxID=1661150 RepID=A0ABW4JEW8_9BACL
MIPKNIKQSHILMALSEIDRQGIHNKRRQRSKYHLVHDSRYYPPKYVLSLANKYANGMELPPSDFGGGSETNEFLASLGFSIKSALSELRNEKPTKHEYKHRTKTVKHNDRCSECKNTVIEMLRNLYGTVKIDHKVDAAAKLEAYKGTSFYPALSNIHNALQQYRGHSGFVRLTNLHRCDLFIPEPGFIVEFDESQHFTEAREIALEQYPKELKLGFNIDQWKALCASIRSKDNDPLDRDEQRSWYDTIRDFLPLIKGFQPTVRIHMGTTEWCKYDPVEDAERFAMELGLPLPGKTSKVTPAKKLTVATIVISTAGHVDDKNRMSLLRRVIRDTDQNTDIILLPAGFFATSRRASKLFPKVEREISNLLNERHQDTVVCIGIDGRDGRDQTALAITTNGIVAAARKYHPTAEEHGYISAASDFLEGEGVHTRIFGLKGRQMYLAVCYDGFGIRQRKINNPGVDVVLDLVHGFQPKTEGNSGDVYFAKHGFAGASKQWKVPVFGAAVFLGRPIPPNWPTGVVWDQGELPTGNWKYEYNPLKPASEVSYGVGNEVAVVRYFSI